MDQPQEQFVHSLPVNPTTTTTTSSGSSTILDTLEDLKQQESRVDAELLKAAGNLSTTTPYTTVQLGQYGLAHNDSPFVITVLAVQAIVSRKLYKHAGHNLEDYFKSRFDISRAQVYRVLDCASLYLDFELRFPSLQHKLLEPYPLKQRLCKTIRSLAPTPYLRQLLWHCTIKKWVLPPNQSNLNDPGGSAEVSITVPLTITVDELTSKHVRDVWDLLVLRGDVRELLELAINEVNNVHNAMPCPSKLNELNLVVDGPNGPELPTLPGMFASSKSNTNTINARRFRSPEPVRDAKRSKRTTTVASNNDNSPFVSMYPLNNQNNQSLFLQQPNTSTSLQSPNSAVAHLLSQHMYQQQREHFMPANSSTSASILNSDMVSSSSNNLVPNLVSTQLTTSHQPCSIPNHTGKQQLKQNVADYQLLYNNGQSNHAHLNNLAYSINPHLSAHLHSRSVSPLDEDSVSNTSYSICAAKNARAAWRGDSTTSDIPSPLLIRHPSPAQFPTISIQHPIVAYGLDNHYLHNAHNGSFEEAPATQGSSSHGYHSEAGICPSYLYTNMGNGTHTLESEALHTSLQPNQSFHQVLAPQYGLNTYSSLPVNDGASMDMMMAMMDKGYGSLHGPPSNPSDGAPSFAKMASSCIDFMQALDKSTLPTANQDTQTQLPTLVQPAATNGVSSVRQRVEHMELNSSDMHEFLCATIESLQELARRGIVLQPLHNAIWLHDVTHWRFFTHSDTCVGPAAMHASDTYGTYTAGKPHHLSSFPEADSSIDLGYNMPIGAFGHDSYLAAQDLISGVGSQFNLGSTGSLVSSSGQSMSAIMAGHEALPPRTHAIDPLMSNSVPLSEPHHWLTSLDPLHHQFLSLDCTSTQPAQVVQTSNSPMFASDPKLAMLNAAVAVSRSDSGHGGQFLTDLESHTLFMKSPSLPTQYDVQELGRNNAVPQLNQSCLTHQRPNSASAENESTSGHFIDLATSSSAMLLSSTGISPSPPAGVASRAFTLNTQSLPSLNYMSLHADLKSCSPTDFQMSLANIDSQIDLVVGSATNSACQDQHDRSGSSAKIQESTDHQHTQQYHAR